MVVKSPGVCFALELFASPSGLKTFLDSRLATVIILWLLLFLWESSCPSSEGSYFPPALVVFRVISTVFVLTLYTMTFCACASVFFTETGSRAEFEAHLLGLSSPLPGSWFYVVLGI